MLNAYKSILVIEYILKYYFKKLITNASSFTLNNYFILLIKRNEYLKHPEIKRRSWQYL